MTGQVGLCQTCSETPKTGFLMSRLIYADGGGGESQVWCRYVTGVSFCAGGGCGGGIVRRAASERQVTSI